MGTVKAINCIYMTCSKIKDRVYHGLCTVGPSAHNFQPWNFLVVTSEEGKEKVQQCYNRPWFANVPMFVLCFKGLNDAWVRTLEV